MGQEQGVLLDTSMLIEILDRGKYLDALTSIDSVCISVISVYEYVRYKRDKRFYKEKLEEAFTVIGLSNEVLMLASEIFDALKRAGTPVSENDIYIAATSLAYDLELWARDTDYKKIKKLFPKLKLRLF